VTHKKRRVLADRIDVEDAEEEESDDRSTSTLRNRGRKARNAGSPFQDSMPTDFRSKNRLTDVMLKDETSAFDKIAASAARGRQSNQSSSSASDSQLSPRSQTRFAARSLAAQGSLEPRIAEHPNDDTRRLLDYPADSAKESDSEFDNFVDTA
jgi:hypothetical protein